MKYIVYFNETRTGEAIVEADSEEEAEKLLLESSDKVKWDSIFYDNEEITNVTDVEEV